jgi:hypothetical protein
VAVAAPIAVVALASCSALAGLDADSTCSDFNDASRQQQDEVIVSLVEEAEGGERNPLREGNAVAQISYVCANNPDTRLGDIAI